MVGTELADRADKIGGGGVIFGLSLVMALNLKLGPAQTICDWDLESALQAFVMKKLLFFRFPRTSSSRLFYRFLKTKTFIMNW